MEERELVIRRARPGEADVLSALAMRSKAYWGYDDAFLEACREALTITEKYISDNPVYVIEKQAIVTGFCSLVVHGDSAELDNLFIDPLFIGRGCGRLLWDKAVEMSKEMGIRVLTIDADPFAEGFYKRIGAVKVGDSESTVVPGRMLPRMEMVIK